MPFAISATCLNVSCTDFKPTVSVDFIASIKPRKSMFKSFVETPAASKAPLISSTFAVSQLILANAEEKLSTLSSGKSCKTFATLSLAEAPPSIMARSSISKTACLPVKLISSESIEAKACCTPAGMLSVNFCSESAYNFCASLN